MCGWGPTNSRVEELSRQGSANVEIIDVATVDPEQIKPQV
jgi:hypothetical protein